MHNKAALTGSLYQNITPLCGTLGTVTKVEAYKVGPQIDFAITMSSGSVYLKTRAGVAEVDLSNDEWNSTTGTKVTMDGK